MLRTRTGVRAYEGRCPHQGALLAEGSLDGDVLTCRNHGWRFDVETGRRLDGPECLRGVRGTGGGRRDLRGYCEPGAISPAPVETLLRAPRPGSAGSAGPAVPRQPAADRRQRRCTPCSRAGRSTTAVSIRFATGRAASSWCPIGPSRTTSCEHGLKPSAAFTRSNRSRRSSTWSAFSPPRERCGGASASWRWLRSRRAIFPASSPPSERSPSVSASGGRAPQRRALRSDIAEEFKRFAVDITTWLALGRDVNTVEGKNDVIERHLGIMFPIFHRRVVAAVPYWRLFRLPSD